jgi:hypothetical protein
MNEGIYGSERVVFLVAASSRLLAYIYQRICGEIFWAIYQAAHLPLSRRFALLLDRDGRDMNEMTQLLLRTVFNKWRRIPIQFQVAYDGPDVLKVPDISQSRPNTKVLSLTDANSTGMTFAPTRNTVPCLKPRCLRRVAVEVCVILGRHKSASSMQGYRD